MKRESHIPRPDWAQKMEALGFGFHSIDGVYWDERFCYRFDTAQIDLLDDATADMHRMCVSAAERVIADKRYAQFAIPEHAIALIEDSWNADSPSLFGRFDLSWDGSMRRARAPKLLEYNADTPTSLIESSVAQWHWLQDVILPGQPDADQFNSIHEKLIARWREIGTQLGVEQIHLACVGDSEEDLGNLEYLRDTVMQAGLNAPFIDIAQIGWSATDRQFVDTQNTGISSLFKLYPWEWLVREAFGQTLANCNTTFIEPAWKMLLANKAILPVLWEMYPDHPNLLPAYFEPGRIVGDYVKKPLLSREGANVSIFKSSGDIHIAGEYGAEGFIYQGFQALPDVHDAYCGTSYTSIGSWIIGDEPAGIGLREDESLVTKNTSRFVPHYFI